MAAALGVLTLTLRDNAARIRYWVLVLRIGEIPRAFSLLVALGRHWHAHRALPCPALRPSPSVQWSALMEWFVQPIAALAPGGARRSR